MVSNENPVEVKYHFKSETIDWNQLRADSLQSGGFGNRRVDLWPRLLRVPEQKTKAEETSARLLEGNEEKPDITQEKKGSPDEAIPHSDLLRVPEQKTEADEKTSVRLLEGNEEKPDITQEEKGSLDEAIPHSDERQIGLDTDRSFVLYPEDPKIDKETLQSGLHRLLVSLFRKRTKLSYFQGYHDIATVFYLTLPEQLQLPCLEKISLHRLRDSMGIGLEPILGLLRVTKNLINLADPEFAGLLTQSSPLPFYALSNLLTLFSHDMPTLPLIQHVFDYLLCRPPIASVYLATAIILSRKQEVIRLQEEDEDGMIHSLLSSLPHLVDSSEGDESLCSREAENSIFFKEEECDSDTNPNRLPESLKEEVFEIPETGHSEASSENPASLKRENHIPSHNVPSHNADHLPPVGDSPPPATQSVEIVAQQQPPAYTRDLGHTDADAFSIAKPDIRCASTHPNPVHPTVTLVELLKTADDLYEKFPPSHSGLALSSIMGPQSVIFTWSEAPSALPSDDMAEAMVAHPHLVVYPHVERVSDQKESHSSERADKASGKHRRKRNIGKSPFGQIEKKTMLAGTIIVLGVAMAVYEVKSRHTGGHGLLYTTEALGPAAKDWKRLAGWLGGALTGMSQKLLNGVSSGQ